MICAPSNAAVDELVLRLKDGIPGYDGKIFKPSVVRVGRTDAINSNVKECTLEELVDKKLETITKKENEIYDGKFREIQAKQKAERDRLRVLLDQESDPEKASKIRSKYIEMVKKIKITGHSLDLQREQIHVNIRQRDIERRKIQASILQNANVVCATLSGSSHNVLVSLQMFFETVVIDEAAQSIELSALIPLKYGCKQCIMVGDPNQLPPTVLSQEAALLKYEQSLFVRMFNRYPDRIHMLDIQFRMHPEISVFPSKEFYRDKLKDGPNNHLNTSRNWHANTIFGPYRFFDVAGQQEQSARSKSLINRNEASVILELYQALEYIYGHTFLNGKIGIISPYKQQVTLLKNVFQNIYGNTILKEIDFNTIDGFQGQEKDIIIISCVRAQKDSRGVGFLGDTRRLNVAITRAKSSLWILGNEKSLASNPVWKRLIEDAKKRGLFSKMATGTMSNPNYLKRLKSDSQKTVLTQPSQNSVKAIENNSTTKSTEGSEISKTSNSNSSKSDNPDSKRNGYSIDKTGSFKTNLKKTSSSSSISSDEYYHSTSSSPGKANYQDNSSPRTQDNNTSNSRDRSASENQSNPPAKRKSDSEYVPTYNKRRETDENYDSSRYMPSRSNSHYNNQPHSRRPKNYRPNDYRPSNNNYQDTSSYYDSYRPQNSSSSSYGNGPAESNRNAPNPTNSSSTTSQRNYSNSMDPRIYRNQSNSNRANDVKNSNSPSTSNNSNINSNNNNDTSSSITNNRNTSQLAPIRPPENNNNSSGSSKSPTSPVKPADPRKKIIHRKKSTNIFVPRKPGPRR